MTALTVHSAEVALYEHGSLVLRLDDAVAERLCKNPIAFSIKNTATVSGDRKQVVQALASRMGMAQQSDASFLQVARALYRELRLLPPYTQRSTRAVSDEAKEVRQAFRVATEPDVLIFETLPEALGLDPFPATGGFGARRAKVYAGRLADSLIELREYIPAVA